MKIFSKPSNQELLLASKPSSDTYSMRRKEGTDEEMERQAKISMKRRGEEGKKNEGRTK